MVNTTSQMRKYAVVLLRMMFVAGVIYFVHNSLGGDWTFVLETLRQVSLQRLSGALLLVVLGLCCTAIVWQRLLFGYGHRIPNSAGYQVFFVGQLGKYIPGFVWTLAAQATMARQFCVPSRVAVATGLVFLHWNVASAASLGAVLALLGHVPASVPKWATMGVALAGSLAMTPYVVAALANALGASANRYRAGWRDTRIIAAMMAATWIAYGGAVVLVAPKAAGPATLSIGVADAVAAYTIAYVFGVMAFLAPAGFGVREAFLAYLLIPIFDVPTAAGISLLIRVIHTVADSSMAVIALVAVRIVGSFDSGP